MIQLFISEIRDSIVLKRLSHRSLIELGGTDSGGFGDTGSGGFGGTDSGGFGDTGSGGFGGTDSGGFG
ncbi:MAG: hypothetical protein MK111_22740, partial [Crocosphaera sp.]|uniref:hypothetical protein n=1 Tax=Crocosphaera sp. TaxID=2729996 RepID=UPI002584E8E5